MNNTSPQHNNNSKVSKLSPSVTLEVMNKEAKNSPLLKRESESDILIQEGLKNINQGFNRILIAINPNTLTKSFEPIKTWFKTLVNLTQNSRQVFLPVENRAKAKKK
jgi:hypothetical protein